MNIARSGKKARTFEKKETRVRWSTRQGSVKPVCRWESAARIRGDVRCKDVESVTYTPTVYVYIYFWIKPWKKILNRNSGGDAWLSLGGFAASRETGETRSSRAREWERKIEREWESERERERKYERVERAFTHVAPPKCIYEYLFTRRMEENLIYWRLKRRS